MDALDYNFNFCIEELKEITRKLQEFRNYLLLDITVLIDNNGKLITYVPSTKTSEQLAHKVAIFSALAIEVSRQLENLFASPKQSMLFSGKEKNVYIEKINPKFFLASVFSYGISFSSVKVYKKRLVMDLNGLLSKTLNKENNPISLRILYHGISQSGKTTNLRKLSEIYQNSVSERIQQQTSNGDVVYFDILSFSMKNLNLELFTTPRQESFKIRQESFKILRRWILGRVDGIVLVIDATKSLEENLQAYEELLSNGFSKIPMVIQLNKVDEGTLNAEDLKIIFEEYQIIQARAKDCIGVQETLKAILKEIANAKANVG